MNSIVFTAELSGATLPPPNTPTANATGQNTPVKHAAVATANPAVPPAVPPAAPKARLYSSPPVCIPLSNFFFSYIDIRTSETRFINNYLKIIVIAYCIICICICDHGSR